MNKNLEIAVVTVTPLLENCYILHNGSDAVVFDPGGDYHKIKSFLTNNNLNVKYILATHGHFDHTGAIAEIKEDYNAKFYIHKDDMVLIDKGATHSAIYGVGVYKKPIPDVFLNDGDIIEELGVKIKVIHTPGHTAGGVSFLIEELNILISGDTLFYESIGRTDFETRNHSDIINSIRNKLYKLNDDINVLPGHGNSTTIGYEKINNPFVKL